MTPQEIYKAAKTLTGKTGEYESDTFSIHAHENDTFAFYTEVGNFLVSECYDEEENETFYSIYEYGDETEANFVEFISNADILNFNTVKQYKQFTITGVRPYQGSQINKWLVKEDRDQYPFPSLKRAKKWIDLTFA